MDKGNDTTHKKAAAIRYSRDLPCPIVIAKGSRRRAEKIMEIAAEHGIKVIRDPALAENVYELEIEQLIPENLYEPLARLLSFVYTIADNERAEHK